MRLTYCVDIDLPARAAEGGRPYGGREVGATIGSSYGPGREPLCYPAECDMPGDTPLPGEDKAGAVAPAAGRESIYSSSNTARQGEPSQPLRFKGAQLRSQAPSGT